MKRKERTATLLVAAACALSLSHAARAEYLVPVQAAPLREACAADYRRLCWGVPPGGGRIVLCLNAHADQLSQGCFQALTLNGLAYAGAFKACQADYQVFCAGVPPGYGRGLQCLLDNANGLSAPCRSALEGHELLTPGGGGQDWDK